MPRCDAPPPLLAEKRRLLQEAGELFNAQRYDGAERQSLELLEIANGSQDTLHQTEALLIAGNSQQKLGKYKQSLQSFEQMLALPQDPRKEKAVQCSAYNGIGNAYSRLGRPTKAISYLEKCLAIAQQLDNEAEQGRSCGNLGNAHECLGQYKAAIEYHERDLVIKQKLCDERGQGVAYGNLGNAYHGLGQYKMAIDKHHKHLGIAEQLDDRLGQGIACANIGNAYHGLEQYDTAIEYHKRKLAIAIEQNDKPGQGLAHSNLGSAYACLGQHRMAIECHNRKLEIAIELDDKLGQAKAYGNLGATYGRLEEYETAIWYSQSYLEISKDLGNIPTQMIAMGNLGVLYAHSGQLDMACSHFASSDALMKELEAQLAEGQWRRHLLAFGEKHARFMDEWVVAAAQSGDMAEALRVEERRRCRSELAYQTHAQGSQNVDVDELKEMARSADASFVVVMKSYDDTLLTWLLSGETGDLLHTGIARQQQHGEVSEWVSSVTFAEWGWWQDQFARAQRLIEKKKEQQQGGDITYAWLERLIERLAPNAMKGDLDDRLWRSIRDPGTFPVTVRGLNKTFKELQMHYFTKAERALQQLTELLWEPMLRKCGALQQYLDGDAPRRKPVGWSLSVYLFCLSCRLWITLCVCVTGSVCAALLFARPALVSHPVLRLEDWRAFSDRKGPCGAGFVAAHSQLCTGQMARHSQPPAIAARGLERGAIMNWR